MPWAVIGTLVDALLEAEVEELLLGTANGLRASREAPNPRAVIFTTIVVKIVDFECFLIIFSGSCDILRLFDL